MSKVKYTATAWGTYKKRGKGFVQIDDENGLANFPPEIAERIAAEINENAAKARAWDAAMRGFNCDRATTIEELMDIADGRCTVEDFIKEATDG